MSGRPRSANAAENPFGLADISTHNNLTNLTNHTNHANEPGFDDTSSMVSNFTYADTIPSSLINSEASDHVDKFIVWKKALEFKQQRQQLVSLKQEQENYQNTIDVVEAKIITTHQLIEEKVEIAAKLQLFIAETSIKFDLTPPPLEILETNPVSTIVKIKHIEQLEFELSQQKQRMNQQLLAQQQLIEQLLEEQNQHQLNTVSNTNNSNSFTNSTNSSLSLNPSLLPQLEVEKERIVLLREQIETLQHRLDRLELQHLYDKIEKQTQNELIAKLQLELTTLEQKEQKTIEQQPLDISTISLIYNFSASNFSVFSERFRQRPIAERLPWHHYLLNQSKLDSRLKEQNKWLQKVSPIDLYINSFDVESDEVKGYSKRCSKCDNIEEFIIAMERVPPALRIAVHRAFFHRTSWYSSFSDSNRKMIHLFKPSPGFFHEGVEISSTCEILRAHTHICLASSVFNDFQSKFRQIPLSMRMQVHRMIYFLTKDRAYQERRDWLASLTPACLHIPFEDDVSFETQIYTTCCLAAANLKDFRSRFNCVPVTLRVQVHRALAYKSAWPGFYNRQFEWLGDLNLSDLHGDDILYDTCHESNKTQITACLVASDLNHFKAKFLEVSCTMRPFVHQILFHQSKNDPALAHVHNWVFNFSHPFHFLPQFNESTPTANEITMHIHNCLAATDFFDFRCKFRSIPLPTMRLEVHRALYESTNVSDYKQQFEWLKNLFAKDIYGDFCGDITADIKSFVDQCLAAWTLPEFHTQFVKIPLNNRLDVLHALNCKTLWPGSYDIQRPWLKNLQLEDLYGDYFNPMDMQTSQSVQFLANVQIHVQSCLEALNVTDCVQSFYNTPMNLRVDVHKTFFQITKNHPQYTRQHEWAVELTPFAPFIDSGYDVSNQVKPFAISCLDASNETEFKARFLEAPLSLQLSLYTALHHGTIWPGFNMQCSWVNGLKIDPTDIHKDLIPEMKKNEDSCNSN